MVPIHSVRQELLRKSVKPGFWVCVLFLCAEAHMEVFQLALDAPRAGEQNSASRLLLDHLK